jgi:peroxiredoxin
VNRRGALTTIAAALATAALAGCTEQGLQATNDAYQDTTEWKASTGKVVTFSGPTADGSSFSSKDHLGSVLVVNFWYAGCNPCRAEAASLVKLSDSYASKGVQFVGVNVVDDAANAQSFARTYKVPYPSILDQKAQGAVQLAFTGTISPKAIPSTLVLDRKGRVVARVVGGINASVLSTLIDDALDGKAA